MKLPAVRKLAESQTLESLLAAEHALLEGEPLTIVVPGDDEGEQLTHILGASWVLRRQAEGVDASTALREFAHRVRQSIG